MEPHDRRTIRSFRTYQDVREDFIVAQDEEPPEAALQELAMLEPRLGDMNNFSDFFAAQLCAMLDPSMFWGLLSLLISLVVQHAVRDIEDTLVRMDRSQPYTRGSIRTTRFFNRDEVIEKIEQHLGNRESTSSLRALALYECRWLIIYYNVKAAELLRNYWPLSGSKGQVLITTRNHSLSFDPADIGIEILPWDTDTCSKFLLHLLAGQISARFLANETKSACSLAERLSGHALALSNMCGLIHRRSWSISELVERSTIDRETSKMASKLVGSYLSKAFGPSDTAWYLDVDREGASLPFGYPMLTVRSPRLSSSTGELLTLALIKKGRYAREFSVHSLIVSQFHRFLKPEDRQKAFFEASILMYNVFPKKPKQAGATRANFYNVWDKCQLLLQHLLQLRTSFVKERKWNSSFSACRETCELWVQCQR
ncbi:uncharacterized protein J7T54_001708 [Emericellopsis cladophorae]|uniref:Uncharacterized protein n=1 Tax=Emericellopsis cladophorae TaxID=2686198 RepID=A0A9Q0BFU7_9HYPO|nr:uncharacterized protein J7T54_001708 [Emericellopsis cladophorae]KAI6783832.1 hypothetical protein J7T54_001708 [Emericellopsis cladophorae]